jgi:Fibronectin type III domain
VAPAAITGPVSSVGATSATVTGTVNPSGQATSWFVEYGTSTSYGSRTATQNAGSGTANAPVSASLTGLTPGTTYHYRIVATNAAGTSRGADGIFATPSAPGVVTGAATSVTVSSATLNGTVDPNGRATTWYFEYGTSTSYGSRTTERSGGSGGSAVGVSAPVSGLTPGRVYHFRLVATSDGGTSRGADQRFSTGGPPDVVTGAAGSISLTSARLNGTLNPNGIATSWYFEYGTSTRYGSRTPTRNAGSGAGRTVTEPLSGLTPGTVYHFRLVAESDAGTSRGADVAFTTTGVTLATPALRVVYGRGLMLSGLVPVRRAGELVTLFAQTYGEGSPRSIATVLTTADGTWRYLAKPRIQTSYLASWNGSRSAATVVAVRPAVSLRRTATGRLATRVVGARSFAGRVVQLQRRSATGRWVTIKRVQLNRRSAALFRATLPRGRSTLRIAMSVNQAGSGYLAGFSRAITVRRP